MKASERMKILRQPMPARDAEERSRQFSEVNLGLSPELALTEAQRCIACPDPKCMTGCPVGIDIRSFVGKIETGDIAGAAEVLYRDNALPGISGRVCPQEKQCECVCVRSKKGLPVAIGYL